MAITFITVLTSSWGKSLFLNIYDPKGTGINKNNVMRNIHPDTTPKASGLKINVYLIQFYHFHMILTYTLSLVRLLMSIPNRLAFINISFNLGISLIVIKNATIDIRALTTMGKHIFHVVFDASSPTTAIF